ncbi:prefoldin subunit [Colletotrichum lupini]|uniref:Prefoldin subunit n=1 Tax=Colletotrichum lupini TaxID=145971 RepID=A0A9Q8WF52_9PEZI|nr:prefoldin subunit [Colletotrichum lupini]UQC81054.1 prefoldin subunit [Colletotrichum lupini]
MRGSPAFVFSAVTATWPKVELAQATVDWAVPSLQLPLHTVTKNREFLPTSERCAEGKHQLNFTMSAAGKKPETAVKDATPSNPRGIPKAPFVDKVEDYVTTREDVEPTMRNFQEMISTSVRRIERGYREGQGQVRHMGNSWKYQFMELNLQKRMAGLNDKIPDIQKTLDSVRFLKLRQDDDEPIETTFELNDTLYSKAKIPPTEEVYIWLGANVMLSYPVDEAETLLESKLSTAKTSLSNCEEDLDFLREQITTMEVAIARVYNWEVVQKRKDKEEGKDIKKEKDEDKAGTQHKPAAMFLHNTIRIIGPLVQAMAL